VLKSEEDVLNAEPPVGERKRDRLDEFLGALDVELGPSLRTVPLDKAAGT